MADCGNIYLIEDDPALCDELERLLSLQGYAVISCIDFADAANAALAASPALVVLDLKLPDTDGHSICKAIRRQSDVPIIVLTSSDDEFDEVMALKLGANDYVTKPYRPAVLLARIESALGRAACGRSAIEHAGVRLDLGSCEVVYRGRAATLTRNEQSVLAMLMGSAGQVVTRHEIMCELWESDAFVDDNTLTVNVNRLRKTLAAIGIPDGFIATERGIGYLVR